jgi:hypothetical protein
MVPPAAAVMAPAAAVMPPAAAMMTAAMTAAAGKRNGWKRQSRDDGGGERKFP